MHHTGPIETIVSGGTFGLPTFGHEEMWLEAARSARKLVVVIANNPDKNPIFSPRERFEMVSLIVSNISNAEVHVMGNKYLVRYAKEIGASDVFRGIRNNNDLMEEQIANSVNRIIEPDIKCKLFIPDPAKNQISSSLVLSLVGFEGWEELVAHYVPEVVLSKLKDWYYTRMHWRNFWSEVDAQDDQKIMWQNISARYGEDHRAYHNLSHITQALRMFDQARYLAEDPLAVEMAIWYHDIKYDPKRNDNEARSAKFARAAARKMGLDDEFGEKVADLIENATMSGTHWTPDTWLLRDIDFSILGQQPQIYKRYAQGIREEYGYVDDQAYREGRTKVLQAILGSKPLGRIFMNGYFRDNFEIAAETNVQAEIETMQESWL